MERLRPRGERRRWVFRSTCLWSTSWRALSPCLRVCDSLARPGVCVPAAMPRSYDTVSSRMKRFQTLPGSSPRLRRSENRRFRSGRLPCVCPSDNRNRGSRGFRGGPSPEGGRCRLTSLLSSCITREHHLASRSTLAESASPSARCVASSLMRAARGFGPLRRPTPPDRLLPLARTLPKGLCEQRSSGRRRTPLGHPCVDRDTEIPRAVRQLAHGPGQLPTARER